MQYFEKIKLSIYFALLVILFISCANIQPPSGGPPDTVPPRIIESSPSDKSLNFNGKSITLIFSEWVERNSVLQNIAISPPIDYTIHWSGKRLDIRFNEPLKPNTTYSFMLGTDYTDIKLNKPDSAFSITFSTGNIIDSGTISGRVVGKDAAGTYIYGFKIDNKNPDTLNFEHTKAEYSTQIGNNGQFTLRALPDGKYRIIAVKSNFRDNLFHPQQDLFGTTNADIQVLNGRSFPQIIKINKYPNLLKADITRITQLDSNLINIELTKHIPLRKFEPTQFQILDTLTNNTVPIQEVWLDSTITNKISILTKNPLQFRYTYKLRITDSTILDIYGVPLDSIEKIFYTSNPPFNFSPKLMWLPFRDSTRSIGMVSEFQFIFNYPLMIDSNVKAIELIKFPDSVNVKISSNLIAANILQVKLNEQINADTWYRFYFNYDGLKGLGNREFQDSVKFLTFKTIDWRSNPSISGHINVAIKCPNVYVILKNSKDEEAMFTKADSLGNWQIDYVPPDTYVLEVYCDENQNGKYDYGLAVPYQHSELFEIYDQKIEIKPRWNIEKLNITFPTHLQFIK